MDIAARLDSLRRNAPGCALIAFGDISTGLILCTSSDRKPPQERLDRLCRTAQELLNGAAGTSAEIALGRAPGSGIDEAIAFNGDMVEVFLRSPAVATDALCCVCAAEMDVESLIERARDSLGEIGGQTGTEGGKQAGGE